MKIVIAAIGKAKRGAQADLVTHYLKQTRWDVSIKGLADAPSNLSAPARRSREGAAILALLGPQDRLVAMDSRGKNLTSEQLAAAVATAQSQGAKTMVFAIGGQDGLAPEVVKRAELTLAFGAATWPHQLLRAMLAEQIYRAYSISVGHPYHLGHLGH